MAKKLTRDQRDLRQAKLETFLKFDPEAQALSSLLRQTRQDFHSQVAVEKGAARGVAATANAAIPKVKNYYKTANQTAGQAQAFIDTHLAPLSPAADPYKASAAVEHAGFLRRLGESRASTLGEFQSRKVDAKAGAAFAVRSARAKRDQDVGKIQGQILSTARQQGAFQAATLENIKQAERQAGVTKRGQDKTFQAAHEGHVETARHNRVQEQAAVRKERQAKAKADQKLAISVLKHPKKGKELQASHDLKGKISDVLGLINHGRQSGVKDHDIRLSLTQRSQDKKGNWKVNNPAGVLYPRDVVNAAFDLEAYGFLSRPNIVALRRRGVRIPRSWLPGSHKASRGFGLTHVL